MSITSDLIRGNTDTIILSCLEKEDSYGYQINRTVMAATNGAFEMKEATLYTAFKRLEDSGCITSYWGDEAQGARRRYYRITPQGASVLWELRKSWQESKEIIDRLTKGENDEK